MRKRLTVAHGWDIQRHKGLSFRSVFDSLDYITGEHVWNFADFATAENVKRVNGNKKGVFTRDRTPKMSAHYLKKRWKNKYKKNI